VSQKKDPASVVVAFFESASLETAQTVLNICRGVVTRRQVAQTGPKPRRKAAAAAVPPADDASER
jgi:hypothetical protein